jgi:hypothetical protein
MSNFIPGPQGPFENIVIGTERRGSGKQQHQRGEKKYHNQCQQYVAGLTKVRLHRSQCLIWAVNGLISDQLKIIED